MIYQNLQEVLDNTPDNDLIKNTFIKADKLLKFYKNPYLSVSGGSDSDILIDLIEKIRFGRCVLYVFFDTGIEYQATKKHLDYLENKYNIQIKREKANKPVPLGCKEYGLPFLSKSISDKIQRLQKHNFDWKDEPLDILLEKYPNCEGGIRWWCNDFGKDSAFNIEKNKYLKEFMIQNPPDFKISDKCCKGAKKDTAKNFDKSFDCFLKITGERRAEGGSRAVQSSCFNYNEKSNIQKYMPLFFWTDKDKKEYKDYYNVEYSDCYEKWGMKRTGCAGCPFGSKFEDELNLIQEHEEKLFLAVNNIFGKSYEYTRKYREFKQMMKEKEKENRK